MSRLENWLIATDNPYQAPEIAKKYLHGEIYDDERGRFSNGTAISTSSIQELNLKENYAVTRNTKYILGEPNKNYLDYLVLQGKRLEDYV